MGTHRRWRDPSDIEQDAGFSTIAIAMSLVGAALLVALLLSSTLHGGNSAKANVSNAPGVGQADNLSAQQTLSSGLAAVGSAAANTGGFGSVDISTLSASDPSTSFVSGPSSNASTVSVTFTAGATAATGGTGGLNVDGGSGTATGGSVTMADRSSNGTCWLVWKAEGGPTWYGAQTGATTCTAPSLTAVPVPGPVTSSSIGWQQSGFPST